MTIWTFGDSFSRHFKYLPDTWVERTASILEQKVNSFSRPVTPIEHMFTVFNRERHRIENNDIVIITLTNIDRRWFFKEYPLKISHFFEGNDLHVYNYYKRFLENLDIQKTYLTNFLYNVNALSKKMNLHTIVIGNFGEYERYLSSVSKDLNYINVAQGVFSFASDREWKREVIKDVSVEWFMKWDKRLNHFSRTNHILIADKIIDNIKNKTIIDLNSGLATEFLTEEILEDPEFRDYELFKDEWKRAGLE